MWNDAEEHNVAKVNRLPLPVVEDRVCEILSRQLLIPRDQVRRSSRLIEDLHCDSLELVELLMELEESFDASLDENANRMAKALFTRQPFRVSDLAELVYLQQGTGKPQRPVRGRVRPWSANVGAEPFSQLSGRWERDPGQPLYEPLVSDNAVPQFRRRSDGMRCIEIPGAEVTIGTAGGPGRQDESPPHTVWLDSFLIDAEPVSTTAYCRFLNSIGEQDPRRLAEWFDLDVTDKRIAHELIERTATGWQPVGGAEAWPMVLVSWHGASAYSLWANGFDCHDDANRCGDTRECFLPSEAQWEYAARGAGPREWPWGDAAPTPDLICSAAHVRSREYGAGGLPLAHVNAPLGMSPFGLHHMAGNVWHWCRDWYAERFYQTAQARVANPVARTPTLVRSERGGSWVGPAELCRSSYRRGRPPSARGRCLGFRCVGERRE